VVSNVAHGITDGLGAAIFAGWPAVALLVAAELLLWLVAAARSMEKRQVVVIEGEQSENGASALSRALTLLANDRSLSAAEIGRQLAVSYPEALRLTKEAKRLLRQTR
jgi:hypothetical protein